MVVRVYISGISGNKEVKKRQQRVTMILDSKNIGYEVVDITEPGKEGERDFMQTKSTSLGATVSDTSPRHPLPPQIFNDEEYCGDYDQFDMANEIDELDKFLKMASAPADSSFMSNTEVKLDNGTTDVADLTADEPEKMDGEPKEADHAEEAEDAEDAEDAEETGLEADDSDAAA